MINIPLCFMCVHYDDKNKSCAAFPDGFTNGICHSAAEEGKICGNGVCFEEIDDEQ